MELAKYKACICEGSAEEAYDQFKRSGKKPSEFCKTNLRMHDVKSYDFVKQYFSNPQLLVKAIKEYRRTANSPKENTACLIC